MRGHDRDPVWLREIWARTIEYQFPADVCEYAHGTKDELTLDSSALAVLVYTTGQAFFLVWAVSQRRQSLAQAFLAITLWHVSHFCAHEFKQPWTWFGSHYFYIIGMWRLAVSVRSCRASGKFLAAWLALDFVVGRTLGDYFGLVSGVMFGAISVTGADTGSARMDRVVQLSIIVLSISAAGIFFAVEILFCERLRGQIAQYASSAHLLVELFVTFASLFFSGLMTEAAAVAKSKTN